MQNSDSQNQEQINPNEEALAQSGDYDDENQLVTDIETQLSTAIDEVSKLKDALLRAAADNDNLRKRAVSDVANAHKYALEKFSGDLLAVKDSLEAALVVENASVESYKSGVELTLKQLVSVFSRFDISEINPVGEKFDPHKHQAMAMVDSEQDANTVVNVMQKGYSLNERILRPALVTVAKS